MEFRFISTLGVLYGLRSALYSVYVLGEIISLHRKYPLLMHVWQTSEFSTTCSYMFLYVPCTLNMLNDMYIFMLNTSTSYLGHILRVYSCVVKINITRQVGLRFTLSNQNAFRLPYRRSEHPQRSIHLPQDRYSVLRTGSLIRQRSQCCFQSQVQSIIISTLGTTAGIRLLWFSGNGMKS